MELLRTLKPARTPEPSPVAQDEASQQVSEWRARHRETAAARRAAIDADAQTAHALAVAVAAGVRCRLTVEDVAPVCELAVAVRRVAASNGVHVPEPELKAITETCEDLATRNARRGYGAFVPIGPLAACLYGRYSPSGSDFGYDSANAYLRDVRASLPAQSSARLAALQNPGLALGAARLAELTAAGVRYHS